MNTPHSLDSVLYRIGAVSKLSGIPVPTLRVWQTRHGAFSPITTLGQHRLYNEDDVRKAVLLKSLTSQGHGISQIAGLSTTQLQQLLHTGASFAAVQAPPAELAGQATGNWAVIGQGLAHRLQSGTFTSNRRGQALPIQQVWADLAAASRGTLDQAPDLLLVSVNGLTEQLAQEIQAVSQQHAARKTVVLYAFGQTGAVTRLRHAGLEVQRDSLNDSALLGILQNKRPPVAAPSWALDTLAQPIPARQFSDQVLQRVANIPSQVLCECPRHVAELIGQLGRFEDYSHDCLNQSPKDAELHKQLNIVAATARALFEKALHMVAMHEGISLQENA
jgi:DNA-binding transcriptional MerR regulator